MTNTEYKILFLGTKNSSRSIMAEAILNHIGKGRYEARSAGSVPAGSPHPKAIETLKRHGIDPGEPLSKSWNNFATMPFNAIVTVCDVAENQHSPVFPGRPKKQFWSISDPSQSAGSETEIDAAFEKVFHQLTDHIKEFIARIAPPPDG